MEKLLSERRGSTRISFASQPTIMLANAEQGSFSATLVDLCADGMCLNTDAPFSPGTQVKAYFPDHRGPSVKARVVRNWSGGMALIVSGSATRRLRNFISRLMCHEQHAKPIILNRAASGSAHPAWRAQAAQPRSTGGARCQSKWIKGQRAASCPTRASKDGLANGPNRSASSRLACAPA